MNKLTRTRSLWLWTCYVDRSQVVVATFSIATFPQTYLPLIVRIERSTRWFTPQNAE
ncbi:hypothetical protein K443DRAFT_592003 [Laccaria amethystina LaAM-08-1]|uniref:Uncharacterized protein n=1 Tax=Laccaria amethystina LaAM-08-1 TaxID=1095629 RepID=A0A0C9XT79_9AGAR|nr:hypothetical protein K443DRAFT_592003 [Laccaria amethystina LaAM-08-1]